MSHRAVFRQMLLEPAEMMLLRLARPPQQETVFARMSDGEIADELAALVEHRSQHQASAPRHAVGHQARQESLGAGA